MEKTKANAHMTFSWHAISLDTRLIRPVLGHAFQICLEDRGSGLVEPRHCLGTPHLRP